VEDWVVVWIGLAALAVIVGGYRPASLAAKWTDLSGLAAVFSASTITAWLRVAIPSLLLASVGIWLMRDSVKSFALAFPIVFLLSMAAHILGGNATASAWGIEVVIFALGTGLLVSNTIGTPEWLLPAVRTEYFIKTGLILMGATIIFGDIMKAGVLGMLQSVLVVLVVWYLSFRLCKWMRLDDEFAAMLSTAVSICGVSAAIAACGAIDGDRRKLSYVTSIVLIVAVPMIVLQPWLIRMFGIPDMVAGAWIGGTLDTTGSVVAASELISETATKIGTIVKFSQNVLIGVAAFLLSIWWSTKGQNGEKKGTSAGVIWSRFPKFVLGFLGASLVFSFLVSPALVASVKPAINNLRTAFFALAFVSIGLETRFTDLLRMEQGRPLVSFLGAQAINVVWTLLLAWLIFGGVLFPAPQM